MRRLTGLDPGSAKPSRRSPADNEAKNVVVSAGTDEVFARLRAISRHILDGRWIRRQHHHAFARLEGSKRLARPQYRQRAGQSSGIHHCLARVHPPHLAGFIPFGKHAEARLGLPPPSACAAQLVVGKSLTQQYAFAYTMAAGAKGDEHEMPDAQIDMKEMLENATDAAQFLKALANPSRLVILCQLTEGERSVGELETMLGVRQPSLSQQLARLRADNLVRTRRDSKRIYYSLASKEAEVVIAALYELFCARKAEAESNAQADTELSEA